MDPFWGKLRSVQPWLQPGYVDPGERRREGPFGDHTGFYSQPDDYPVFHLTCITQRRQPVYATTIVGPPPMEDFYMGKAIERIPQIWIGIAVDGIQAREDH